MKSWLSRAVANTALRGEDPRNRFARWTRWFPATPAVDDARFQGAGDPYPRHWRRPPNPWPEPGPPSPAAQTRLRAALGELPTAWRDVVQQRDVDGRNPAEVPERLGLTAEQQRAMLNRARAFLRERLAQYLARVGSR